MRLRLVVEYSHLFILPHALIDVLGRSSFKILDRTGVEFNFFCHLQVLASALSYHLLSVLPRLRFCAIVTQNFEYDAAKTVPTGHLAHIDFGLSQDFESFGCVEKSHAKNNIVFHRNSGSCNGYFDWCIGFLNCTGTSVQ